MHYRAIELLDNIRKAAEAVTSKAMYDRKDRVHRIDSAILRSLLDAVTDYVDFELSIGAR